MTEETEQIDDPQTIDEAFGSAIEPKTLDEIELHPFSLLRKNVAYHLGITGDPESVFHDAVLVAWLMSQTDAEVARARRDKDKSVVEAFAWAEKQGFDRDNGKALITLLNRIMAEISRSTEIETNGDGTESKNVGRPPAI